jgi:hypothetical protein
MNGTINFRVNTVKNIGSNVNQGFYRHHLKHDSLSTLKPCSHVAFQTLRTAGIFVHLVLAPLPDTKFLPNKVLQFRGC